MLCPCLPMMNVAMGSRAKYKSEGQKDNKEE